MELDNSGWWTLNIDGGSRQIGASLGLQLKAPTREIIKQTIPLNFLASNNEAEYEAIIVGLDLAISVSSEKIIIRSNSQLVVGQVNGEYQTKDQRMAKHASFINLWLGSFRLGGWSMSREALMKRRTLWVP